MPRRSGLQQPTLKVALSISSAKESETVEELHMLLEQVQRPALDGSSEEAASEVLPWGHCLLVGDDPWDSFTQVVRACNPDTLCGLIWRNYGLGM